MPQIVDENLDQVKYFLDDKEINFTSNFIESQLIKDGSYKLTIFATDLVGFNVTKSFPLNIDNTKPTLLINSPPDNMTVSEILPINFQVIDANLPESGGIRIILPNGELRDQTQLKFDTSQFDEGPYEIKIFAEDKAGNKVSKEISFNVDHSMISQTPFLEDVDEQEQNYLLVIGIVIGLAIGIISVLFATKKIKISVSK
jgi:hypothetical protein